MGDGLGRGEGGGGGGGGERWSGFVDVCGVRMCNNINNYSNKP